MFLFLGNSNFCPPSGGGFALGNSLENDSVGAASHQKPPTYPHPAQVEAAEAAGLAQAHMASWLRAMKGLIEGQESKGHWLATKSCKNQPLTCLQTLPNPHSCSIYLSILGPPPNQTASEATRLKKSPSPPRGQTHTSQVTQSLGDLERKQG